MLTMKLLPCHYQRPDLSAGIYWVSVRDQCNLRTDLVPEYPLETSVHCTADSDCAHQYDFSQVWNFSAAVVWKQVL